MPIFGKKKTTVNSTVENVTNVEVNPNIAVNAEFNVNPIAQATREAAQVNQKLLSDFFNLNRTDSKARAQALEASQADLIGGVSKTFGQSTADITNGLGVGASKISASANQFGANISFALLGAAGLIGLAIVASR